MADGPHLHFEHDEHEDEQKSRASYASNLLSRDAQKKRVKRQYFTSARTEAAAGETAGAAETVDAIGAKAGQIKERIAAFVREHKKGVRMIAALVLALVLIVNMLSSCTVIAGGSTEIIALTTYPSADVDMLIAEMEYCELEDALRNYLDTYEETHDYDEYYYNLDEIGHDPYVLISFVTAWFSGAAWTIEEARPVLDTLFAEQYTLTENVVSTTIYRNEILEIVEYVTDPDTGEVVEIISYEEAVMPYEYRVCTVTLENADLSHLPVYMLSEYQLSFYAMYMSTLGNRPDLFPESEYIDIMYGDYPVYEVPPEALEDAVFAKMLNEAEKYLGYPYIWGGSSPATSFDCSGFVSWVINNCGVGWNVGRLGATALYYIGTPVSYANARPGDLVFFQGTYDADGMSHVGIYVGDGWMLHCGSPIQYANINTEYWQAHLAGFCRLTAPD